MKPHISLPWTTEEESYYFPEVSLLSVHWHFCTRIDLVTLNLGGTRRRRRNFKLGVSVSEWALPCKWFPGPFYCFEQSPAKRPRDCLDYIKKGNRCLKRFLSARTIQNVTKAGWIRVSVILAYLLPLQFHSLTNETSAPVFSFLWNSLFPFFGLRQIPL